MSDWYLYKGPQEDKTGSPAREEIDLGEITPPPWRNFKTALQHRGQSYLPSVDEVAMVNAALRLCRPLLVTGPPGCGKSSLAYSIAEELQMGPVLKWPINSRTQLADGLYHYDAVSRLREANLAALKRRKSDGAKSSESSKSKSSEADPDDIRQFVRLRALGTALSSPKRRVVLIDEIDKADVDLPNDLLDVLEEGMFVIPELQRTATKEKSLELLTCEPDVTDTVKVENGVVKCRSFPMILITSNGERELPLAFLRRCLRLDIQPPQAKQLENIVSAHLGDAIAKDDKTRKLIEDFLALRDKGQVLATDQLLNMVHLVLKGTPRLTGKDSDRIQELVFRGLNT